VPVDIALGPSATLFRAGEQLRLVVAGRWLWPRNLFTGQFPAAYEHASRGSCTLHWGPDRDAHLLIPVIPRDWRRRTVASLAPQDAHLYLKRFPI
jgi:hypothetical protein